MKTSRQDMSAVADRLAALYADPFGGKSKGRYRIAGKVLRNLAGRQRLYEEDIRHLTREMLERGFVLVDMDTFYVILSSNTFVNYRRASSIGMA